MTMYHIPQRPSPAGIEFQLYKNRPDLWALGSALRHAKQYKEQLWALLSDADKEALRSHRAVYLEAVEGQKASAAAYSAVSSAG